MFIIHFPMLYEGRVLFDISRWSIQVTNLYILIIPSQSSWCYLLDSLNKQLLSYLWRYRSTMWKSTMKFIWFKEKPLWFKNWIVIIYYYRYNILYIFSFMAMTISLILTGAFSDKILLILNTYYVNNITAQAAG